MIGLRSICVFIICMWMAYPCFADIDSTVNTSIRENPTILPSDGNVLVLGSAGFIGKYLVQRLTIEGYNVEQVYNRSYVDVRDQQAFTEFIADKKIAFCFFLACEVGGSKYIGLDNKHAQLEIIESNMKIYQAVLPTLRTRGIPYLFTSSYLQSQQTPYASVKRLGEEWIKASNAQLSGPDPLAQTLPARLGLAGYGKLVRLWNIYGRERLGLRSHVVCDWASQCVRDGAVTARTNGLEARQLLHGEDVARALVLLMRYFSVADLQTDISTGVWVTLRHLADLVSDRARALTGTACPATFPDIDADVRARISPREDVALYRGLGWRAQVPLEAGLDDIVSTLARGGPEALSRLEINDLI